jgi:hypothetical protein
MRRTGPDAAVAIIGEFELRLREPATDALAASSELLAVGWDQPTHGVHIHHPRLKYLIYDAGLHELLWLDAADVIGVYRRDERSSGTKQ